MTRLAFDNRSSGSRERFRGVTSAVVVAGLVATLAACSAYEYVTDAFSTPIVLPCPKSWVIADAANLTKFRKGGGHDLIDVDYEGEMTGLKLGCTTNVDKKTSAGTMDVDVEVLFNATRGPANRDHKALFKYFVSVTDKDHKILYREAFSLPLEFPGNKTKLQIRSDPITLQLPIAPKLRPDHYLIFAGYELSHQELDFNRTRRNKTGK